MAIATLASCNIRANRTEQATSEKPDSVTTTTAQKQRPTKRSAFACSYLTFHRPKAHL